MKVGTRKCQFNGLG